MILRTLIVAGILFFQQEPPPDIPDDSYIPEVRSLSCDNFAKTPTEHKCHCERDEQKCEGGLPQPPANVLMSKKCLTKCYPNRCKCAGKGCTS